MNVFTVSRDATLCGGNDPRRSPALVRRLCPATVALMGLCLGGGVTSSLGQPATPGPIPAMLRCSAHSLNPVRSPAYDASLTFVRDGTRIVATRVTQSRPGHEVFEGFFRTDGHVRISGSGSFDNGGRWRWAFDGGLQGDRTVVVGGLYETAASGVDTVRRSCTIELMLPPSISGPPAAAITAPKNASAAPAQAIIGRDGRSTASGQPEVELSTPPPEAAHALDRGLATKAPPPSPAPAERRESRSASARASAAISGIPCEAFYDMQTGLNESAWRTVSDTPLTALSSPELAQLRTRVNQCKSLLGSSNYRDKSMINHRLSLMDSDLDPGIGSIARGAAQREEAVRVEKIRTAEREREQATKAEARSTVIALVTRVASGPPNAVCSPTPQQLGLQIAAKFGEQIFRTEIESSAPWKAILADCLARERTAATLLQRDNERRQEQAIEARARYAYDFVATARAKHAEQVESFGFPPQVLTSRLILTPNVISQMAMLGFDSGRLTFADWVSLIVEAHPDGSLSATQDASSGDWGLAVKLPGERTQTLYVHLDGSELFLSQLQIGSAALPIVGPDNSATASMFVYNLSGIIQVFADYKPDRQQQGRD